MNSESLALIPANMEKWESCVLASNDDRVTQTDLNCVKSDVHHPHKGGTSNIAGSLSVSDFRLRFTQSDNSKPPVLYGEDYLMSYDIPITSMHRINFIPRKNKKKAKVSLSGGESFKASDDLECCQIEVLSADFTIMKFETFGSRPFSKSFIDKLSHFGSRRDVSKLFGIEIGQRILYKESQSDQMEWIRRQLNFPPDGARIFPEEVPKVKAKPELGWIPKSISDRDLIFYATMLEDKRIPTLSCSFEDKGMLLRCGKVSKAKRTEFTDHLKQRYRKSMGSSNDFQSQTLETVEIVKLKRLPKFEDVAQARRRLRELCQCYNPENENSNWLEALDSTQWLTFVSKTLTFALEIAAKIKEERKWIVMMENRASDWSCVIASLVNIILFPRYRQKTELESLIVREWCLPRHPFSSRLELAAWPEDDRPGPLFPLFLDCVHQIWNQYPTEFDFTTDLLAVLHDASHAGLFREFLFHVEREEASLAPSVFHWKRLLSSDGLLLVQNPIWELAQLMGETKLDVLQIDVDVRQMRLWKEHYMRALTFMDIGQAGRAAYMWRLREMLGTLTVKPETDGVERRKKGNTELKLPSGRDFSDISAFFPLSHEVSVVDTSRASCLPIRPHSVNDMLD